LELVHQVTRLIKAIALEALGDPLQKAGFDRTNLTWRRRADPGAVQVINVQMGRGRNRADGQLTLNAGVYFPALARRIGDFPAVEDPEEHDCQVRTRPVPLGRQWWDVRLAGVSKVDPDAGALLGRLFSWLDRRADSRADERNERVKQELRESFDRCALPWLERVSSLAGARDELERRGPLKWAVAASLELGERDMAVTLFRRALEKASPEHAEHLREWGQTHALVP
jgi:hypothetical protein